VPEPRLEVVRSTVLPVEAPLATWVEQELSVNSFTVSPFFTPLTLTVGVAVLVVTMLNPEGTSGAAFIVTEISATLLSDNPEAVFKLTLNL